MNEQQFKVVKRDIFYRIEMLFEYVSYHKSNHQ